MTANDKALDQIHDGVVRIKGIATGMNNELDSQKRLLDDVDDSMDRVNDRLKNNTNQVKDIGEKTKCGFMFWFMIILIILIVV
jgi:archaellum component FlaC